MNGVAYAVRTVTTLRAAQHTRFAIRFPARANLPPNIHPFSGAHSALEGMGGWGSFPRGKAAGGRTAQHSTP
jgi:hypothetical protein